MVFGLYTKKDLEREVEKQLFEMDQRRWIDERFERIEKRLWKLEHPKGTQVDEACTTCGPCPDEDFG